MVREPLTARLATPSAGENTLQTSVELIAHPLSLTRHTSPSSTATVPSVTVVAVALVVVVMANCWRYFQPGPSCRTSVHPATYCASGCQGKQTGVASRE